MESVVPNKIDYCIYPCSSVVTIHTQITLPGQSWALGARHFLVRRLPTTVSTLGNDYIHTYDIPLETLIRYYSHVTRRNVVELWEYIDEMNFMERGKEMLPNYNTVCCWSISWDVISSVHASGHLPLVQEYPVVRICAHVGLDLDLIDTAIKYITLL